MPRSPAVARDLSPRSAGAFREEIDDGSASHQHIRPGCPTPIRQSAARLAGGCFLAEQKTTEPDDARLRFVPITHRAQPRGRLPLGPEMAAVASWTRLRWGRRSRARDARASVAASPRTISVGRSNARDRNNTNL